MFRPSAMGRQARLECPEALVALGTLVSQKMTECQPFSDLLAHRQSFGYDTFFIIDAMHIFDHAGPDGSTIPADHLSVTTAANHHGEFATVITTDSLAASAVWPGEFPAARKPAVPRSANASRS